MRGRGASVTDDERGRSFVPWPRARRAARTGRASAPSARRRALPGVPAALQGRPPERQARSLRDRPPRRRRLPLPALRRGGLPTRPARLGDDLLLGLQPALRLLPELGHLLARELRAGEPRAAGGGDARAPSDRRA